VKCRLFFVLLVVAAALGFTPPTKSPSPEKYEMEKAKRSVVSRNLGDDSDNSDNGGNNDDGGNDDDDTNGSSSSKSLYDCGDPTQSMPPANVYADFMYVVNKIGSTHACFGNPSPTACNTFNYQVLCDCAITDDSRNLKVSNLQVAVSKPLLNEVGRQLQNGGFNSGTSSVLRDFRSYDEGLQFIGCCAEFYGTVGLCGQFIGEGILVKAPP